MKRVLLVNAKRTTNLNLYSLTDPARDVLSKVILRPVIEF